MLLVSLPWDWGKQPSQGLADRMIDFYDLSLLLCLASTCCQSQDFSESAPALPVLFLSWVCQRVDRTAHHLPSRMVCIHVALSPTLSTLSATFLMQAHALRDVQIRQGM